MEKAKRNKVNNIQEDSNDTDSTDVIDSSERVEKADKVTNLYLEKLEQEIRNGYRIFSFRDKEYKIYLPKIKEDDLINRFKSQTTSKLLENKDIYMKDQLVRRLYEREVWNDEKEKEEKSLREQLGKVMADIMIERAKEFEDKDALKEFLAERINIEVKLSALTETKNHMISSSLENILNEAIHKYKMCLCVRDSEDNLLWDSMEVLDNETDKILSTNISEAAMYFWAGLDPSLFSLAPGI